VAIGVAILSIIIILVFTIGSQVTETIEDTFDDILKGLDILANPPIYRQSLDVANALGEVVTLTEYRNATDQNWSTVLNFLQQDHTEQRLYDDPGYVCADFARDLHDRAEQQGIRCGYVGISFSSKEIDPRWYTPASSSDHTINIGQINLLLDGHALNVFNTTDRGLIYVDMTNDGITGADKIAYLKRGEEYNTLRISQIDQENQNCFSYSYYQTTANRYFQYLEDLKNYNDRVVEYNRQVQYYNAHGGAPSNIYYSLQSQGNQLDRELSGLNTRDEATWMMSYPTGKLNDIKIYW
jgi:hypothetical protein